MKTTTFKGVIDGQSFDNIKDFQKYLEEHKDAKSVYFSSETKEETASHKETKSLDKDSELNLQPEGNPVTDETANSLTIYPPTIDVDRYLEEHKDTAWEDLDDVKKMYDEFVTEHNQAIYEMCDDLLVDHRDNLVQLHDQATANQELNEQVLNKITNRRKTTESSIYDLSVQIEDLIKQRSHLLNQQDQDQDSIDKLEIADRLLAMRREALEKAISDLDHKEVSIKGSAEIPELAHQVVEHEDTDPVKLIFKPLEKLFADLFINC